MLLSDLSETLQAKLIGDEQGVVTGVNTIADASASEICFLTSDKYAGGLMQSRAAAVIIAEALDDCPIAQLVVKNVDMALIEALQLFAPKLTLLEGIHPSAIIESTAQLDSGVAVGPGAYISHHVSIGTNTVVGPGCVIGENSKIGSDCRFDSHVVIYHNCTIGNRCIIQANSTIGSTGYGYSFIDGQHRLVPHNGGVIIEDDVEIGANSCVDRAKFGNTLIGAGTKVDNLVQIAHNCKVGKLSLLAGQVGMAGSVSIGNGVVLAGQVGVGDNRAIGDGAVIAAKSAVLQDIPAGQTAKGIPAREMQTELRSVSVYRRLPEIAKELKKLQKKVERLEAAKNNQK